MVDDKRSAADNRLIIYSSIERHLCAGLFDEFTSRHPEIEVEVRAGISVALHERYVAELAAGTPQADILWSTAMDLQMGLVMAGQALAYHSAESADLPAGATYRDMAYAATAEPLVTLVNRERFDVRLPAGSISEITAALRSDPARYRGRVACFDIESNGLGFLALLHESRNTAEFDAFMRVLAECRPRAFGSNPELVEEVASGRAALGYHVLGSFALRAARANAALAIAATNAPLLAVSRVALIPASAPHPHAAQLFLDHLLSRSGQQQLQVAGLYPIRGDANAGPEALGKAMPIAIAECCEELLDERRRRDVRGLWQAAVAAPHSLEPLTE